MTLGTSIFLSVIVLAAVFLFIARKNTWNWRKIFIYPLVIVILIGCSIFAYSLYKDIARPINEFWNISLSDTKPDVKFKKGAPKTIDGSYWVYPYPEYKDNNKMVVKFESDRVVAVFFQGSRFDAPDMAGFNIYSDLEDMVKKYGEPTEVSRSDDELKRIYSFKPYNIMVIFQKGEVNGVGIFSDKPLKYKSQKSDDDGDTEKQ